MTLQPSEPDFMLERKEGSVVIEKPYKEEKKREKKGRFTGRGCHPLGSIGTPESSGQPVSSLGRLPEEHSFERKRMHRGL